MNNIGLDKKIEVTDTSSVNIPQRSGLLAVERKDWDRILRLINKLSLKQSIWENLAFFFLSTALSFIVTYFSVGEENKYKIAFFTASIFSAVITVLLYIFSKKITNKEKSEKQEIIDEMTLMEQGGTSPIERFGKELNTYFDNVSANISEETQDQLFERAVAIVKEHNKASTSFLQREMSIGYARAARMINKMEELGIVGPPSGGSAPRSVLQDKETDKADPDKFVK